MNKISCYGMIFLSVLSCKTAVVRIQKSTQVKTQIVNEFEGSGNIDYRLHDIWVLEELNGRKISKIDFSKEFPLLEIFTKENKFLGFAGCNQINGSLSFEKGKLRFTNLTVTKLVCEPENKEAEFITALQSSDKYQIANNRLILSYSSEVKMILRKMD
jgi:heat shock protein HslJ